MKCAFLFFSFVFPSPPHFALPAFRGYPQDTGEACGAQPVRYSMSFQMPIETATASTVRTGIIMYFARIALPAFFVRSAFAATLKLMAGLEPATSSLPRYNPKQKGHYPPQHTPSKSPKHHNILCFFFPKISLAVSRFPDLTAKYSQSRLHAVFPRLFPPFELPVSAPLLQGFCNRKSISNNGSIITSLTAIY